MNLSISNFKNKLPYSFLLALLFAGLYEIFIFPHVLPLAVIHSRAKALADWSFKMDSLEKGKETSEILFLGDSVSMGSVNARRFQEITGYSAYNYALSGMQSPGHYFLLKRYLEKNPPPKLIYYAPSSFFLNDSLDKEFTYQFVAWFASPSELVQLLPDLLRRDGKQPLLKMMTRFLLPSYIYRHEVSTFLRESLRGGLSVSGQEYSELIKKHTMNQGFRVLMEHFWSKEGLTQEALTAAFNTDTEESRRLFSFAPSRLNRKYLEKMLNLCRQNNIKVVFFFGPIPQGLFEMREKTGYNQKLTEWTKALQMDFPEIILPSPLIFHLPNKDFLESSHVDDEGAETFTRSLSELNASVYPSAP